MIFNAPSWIQIITIIQRDNALFDKATVSATWQIEDLTKLNFVNRCMRQTYHLPGIPSCRLNLTLPRKGEGNVNSKSSLLSMLGFYVKQHACLAKQSPLKMLSCLAHPSLTLGGKRHGGCPDECWNRVGAALPGSWLGGLCGLVNDGDARLPMFQKRGLEDWQLLVGLQTPKALGGLEHAGGGPA